MMRTALLSSFFLFVYSFVFAQTVVTEDVTSNTTWSLAGSPYILEQTIVVEENVVLSISPGVIVKYDGNAIRDMMIVDGSLVAQGTEQEPIVFTVLSDDTYGGDTNNDGSATNPKPGDYRGILIKATSGSTSVFEHCLFRFGGRTFGADAGALIVEGSNPTVNHCRFTQCEVGFSARGTTNVNVSNCVFEENTEVPITVALNSSPVFSGNTFVNNANNAVGITSFNYEETGQEYVLEQLQIEGMPQTAYLIFREGLEIGEGVSLTISPGVAIKYSGNSIRDLMTIHGTLVAEGTEQEPIVFTVPADDSYGGDTNNDGTATSPSPRGFLGIRVKATSGSTSVFEHCLFRFGGRTFGADAGALIVEGSNPTVNHCRFTQCEVGFSARGTTNVNVSNCIFEENTEVPITVALNSSPVFSGNTFVNNANNAVGITSFNYEETGQEYVLEQLQIEGMPQTSYLIFREGMEIGEGVSLTISPGVTIKYSGNSIRDLMTIHGTLVAEGTEQEPIVFTVPADDSYGGDTNNDGTTTSPSPRGFLGIRVKATSGSTSVFEHCLFRFGGRTFGADAGALIVEGSNPTVNHCRFTQCEVGFSARGTTSVNVSNCVFEENTEVPITVALNSSPVFSGNTFVNNANNAVGITSFNYEETGQEYVLEQLQIEGMLQTSYLIFRQGLEIGEGVSLTISPGVTIKYSGNSIRDLMTIHGTLVAEGTEQEPIVFTVPADDSYGGDTNNDGTTTSPSPRGFLGIRVKATSGSTSVFEHCLFRFGGRAFGANAGALIAEESNPTVNRCRFTQCEVGFVVSGDAEVSVENTVFTANDVAVKSLLNTANFQIDSSLFDSNGIGIQFQSGSGTIRGSTFQDNQEFDIENLSEEDIDATNNWWGIDNFILIGQDADDTNLATIYDKLDDSSKGKVAIYPSSLPPAKVFRVEPNQGLILSGETIIKAIAYPVEASSTIQLHKDGQVITPTTVNFIDSLELEATFTWGEAEPGIYDVWIINPDGDTLKLEEGFSLLDLETIPFDQWVPFEVSKGDSYAAGVVVPEVDNLFVFLKKSTRIGYSSTWNGSLRLAGIAQDSFLTNRYLTGSASDIDKHCPSPEPGGLIFEVETTNEQGAGQILITDAPPKLTLGEWSTGEILRPYGYDWKMVEVPEGQANLFLRTEGFGLWSRIEVFLNNISNPDQYWYFNNWGQGYQIEGQIENPPPGTYYIRYLDSAVLLSESQNPFDEQKQEREYLILADSDPISPTSNSLPLKITGLSTNEVGKGIATFNIYGVGFSNADSIYISRNGIQNQPLKKSLNTDEGYWSTTFDFSEAEEGEWEVSISNQTAEETSPDNLSVIDIEELEIDVNVITSNVIREGRWRPFIVELTNTSNFDANFTYVNIQFSGSPDIREDFEIGDPSTVNDSIDWTLFEGFNDWSDVPVFFETIDSVSGEKITNLPLVFPVIKPGETVTFELNIKYVNASEFNYKVSVINSLSDVDEGDFKTTGGSQVTNGECVREVAIALVLEIAKAITDLVLNTSGFEGCGKAVASAYNSGFSKNQVNTIFGKKPLPASAYYMDIMNAIASCTIAAGVAVFPAAKLIKVLQTIVNLMSDLKTLQTVYYACDPNESENSGSGSIVGSTTPEDKYGIVGAERFSNLPMSDRQNFINRTDQFAYRIDYWNKEDATAPAAEVFIKDTLDEKFNLTTFNFTEVGFLRWKVPLDGGHYFNVTVDMRPDENYLVNIEGTLNPFTREIYWVHRTLDPATLDLPEDPFSGYLPPIDPEGYNIGWVNFSVEPNKDLPSGTVFKNQARVNFDGVGPWGPAPPYGPYTNTFDFDAPDSRVLPLDSETADTSLVVNWTGEDGDGAGIQHYNVYVSENDDPYEIWQFRTSDSSAEFVGEVGNVYRFYSEAVDKVGNVESAPNQEDAITNFVTSVVDLSSRENGYALYQNYPNPFTNATSIRFEIPHSLPVLIEVFNETGLVTTLLNQNMQAGKHAVEWVPQNNVSGLYYLRMTAGKFTRTKKMILME